MNKERIEQIASAAYWQPSQPQRDPVVCITEAITLAVNEALEDACKAVYGNCESDNVAQRTVDAIRKMRV